MPTYGITKKFLVKVLEESEQGIHIVNKDGYTLFYNRAAEIIDGMTKKEMTMRNMKDLVSSGTFSTSVALEAIKTGETKEVIQQIKDKTVIATGVPIFNKDQLEAVVVFTKDSKTLQEMTLKMKDLLIENNAITEYFSSQQIKSFREDLVISYSKAMKRTMKTIERVARLDAPIFLLGEVGVGKTMFARYIHNLSMRSDKPFIKVDCAAIPESIIEKELFGSIKEGSLFEVDETSLLSQAMGGTLFLDEIADMPISCQRRLAYTLDKLRFGTRENGIRNYKSIRILSASNESVKENLGKGRLREDLYYKLNIIQLQIPSLRERTEDKIPLLNVLLNKYNTFYQEKKELSPGGKKLLLNYSWPGNVSEMENVIERLIVTSDGEYIQEKDIIELIGEGYIQLDEKYNFKEKVENYEKKLIIEYSKQARSIKELAALLDINESTLRKKIIRYGINITFY